MTSGNVSDEPIAYRDDEALRAAGRDRGPLPCARPPDPHADRRLGAARRHDRRRTAHADAAPLARLRARQHRRCRSAAARHVLACGAELKNTFCLAKGERAWVGHHVGDLANFETLTSFQEGIAHFERLFAVEPTVVAHDLHPRYLSTAYALEREAAEHVGVQHHHAHLAACLAEHGMTEPAVGAIFDGTGYGTDGTVWGGELLLRRPARVRAGGPPAPGAHAGRRAGHPRAVAHGVCVAGGRLGDGAHRARRRSPASSSRSAGSRWRSWRRSGLASPLTSSAGRLFDAVAALCGVRARVNYEGQAAVELEAVADRDERAAYPLALRGRCARRARDRRGGGAATWPRGVPAGDRVGALPQRARTSDRRRVRADRRSARDRRQSCCPAASSRTRCCWSAPPPPWRSGPAGARPAAPAAQRRRHLLRPGRGRRRRRRAP